jgi:hypothetical protein
MELPLHKLLPVGKTVDAEAVDTEVDELVEDTEPEDD